jgi:hypothetical protein
MKPERGTAYSSFVPMMYRRAVRATSCSTGIPSPRSSSLGIDLAADPMPSANPCMASMEVDPELSDTLMHLSGYIFRAAINAGLRRK